MTWGAVLVAVFSALGSGGVLAAVFKWISDRPHNKAQAEEIWRRMNSTALQEAESKSNVKSQEIMLIEFKFDLMADLFSEALDRLAIPAEDRQRLRSKFMKIKYLQKVEDYSP